MKPMPFPSEAEDLHVSPVSGWLEDEVRVARWLAREQAGGAIAIIAVSHAVRRELAAALKPAQRLVLADPSFADPHLLPRDQEIGTVIIDAAWWTQLATEAALDYFASRPWPCGLILWQLRPPGRFRSLPYVGGLSHYFDVREIDRTRLALLDLARAENLEQT